MISTDRPNLEPHSAYAPQQRIRVAEFPTQPPNPLPPTLSSTHTYAGRATFLGHDFWRRCCGRMRDRCGCATGSAEHGGPEGCSYSRHLYPVGLLAWQVWPGQVEKILAVRVSLNPC